MRPGGLLRRLASIGAGGGGLRRIAINQVGGAESRIRAESHDADFGLRTRQMASGVVVQTGHPGRVLEIDDALWVPGINAIYDRFGNRVLESCLRRGPELSELDAAGAPRIDCGEAVETIAEPVLFVSAIPAHWGHFLTEGISRLWAPRAYPELAGLRLFAPWFHQGLANVVECLRGSAADPARIISRDHPVQLRKCVVPVPSFANRGRAFIAHREFPQAVATGSLSDVAVARSDQPLYLSRSRLRGSRLIRNEAELERRLGQRGVRIIYPETMSLARQVEVFRRHHVFLGCCGSAFHTLLFAAPKVATTYVLCDSVPNMNFLMLDAVMGIRAHYVQLLSPTPGMAQQWPDLDLTLNVDAVMAYFVDSGIVPRR